MIVDGMPLSLVRALLRVDRADGQAYRSNYNGEHPDADGWPVYWRCLDTLVGHGLAVRVGRFYYLTAAGEELVEEMKRRRWRLVP